MPILPNGAGPRSESPANGAPASISGRITGMYTGAETMEWSELGNLWPLLAFFLLLLRKRKGKKGPETPRARKVPTRSRDEGQGFRKQYEPIEPK